MKPRPPRSTRTDTLFPYTTRFRSQRHGGASALEEGSTREMFLGDEHGRHPLFRVSSKRRFRRALLFGALWRRPVAARCPEKRPGSSHVRSEEHTSELQSLMRISYAVFCLKKKKNTIKMNYTK